VPMPSDRHRLWSILGKKESSLTAVEEVELLPEPQTLLTLQLVTATTINLRSREEMWAEVRRTTIITTTLHRGVDLREPPGTTYHPTLYLALVALTPSTQVKN
jgi:hypothetical protein